jgi:hypothetical protein
MSARCIFVAWIVLGPSLAACTGATPPAASTDTTRPSIAAVHVAKCGACHAPPDPKTRTREYLESALSRHRKRVRLTSEEWSEMTDYLAMPEGKTARQP